MANTNEQNRRVLLAVREYFAEFHRSPTLREVATRAGYLAQSSVIPRLQDLASYGYITYEPGIARGIGLTRKRGEGDA